METYELKTVLREAGGKGAARTLRRDGLVPAVIYGPKTEPILISVNAKEFSGIRKKAKLSQSLLTLVSQNGLDAPRTVMIKELQKDPLSFDALHIDFFEVAMDKKIKVKIPVMTKGKCKGVELGGMLQVIRREVEILCLPSQIPDRIELDVTNLDIGDSIHVQGIELEGDIEILADVNFTVVTVLGVKKEVVETEGDEEEADEEASEEAEA